jgi:indole-3-glycerol phosphate synthase
MGAKLDEITAATRARIARSRPSLDRREAERAAEGHTPRGFRRALEAKSKPGPAIIAELKKASPSRGMIRADFHAGELASELEKTGAAALSVLTDEEFFQGSLENLRQASSHSSLPCLRKDFIVDEIQVVEARANRADAILLIVAALSQNELESLREQARKYELDVLCEVHDHDELRRAIDAGCDLIGVNNRDLRTLQVNLDTAFRLAEHMPKNAVCVAESGIGNGGDIARLQAAGYSAFLIGESLMKERSPGSALRGLIEECQGAVAPAKTGN